MLKNTVQESPMDAVEQGQGSPDDDVRVGGNLGVVEVGNPGAGGNYVPALPPTEDVEEAETEVMFGEFEYVGEVDSATSCHMDAFRSALLRWYKSKNYTTTLMTKEKYNRLCDFCSQINDGVDCVDLRRKGYTQAYKWEKKFDMISVGESRIVVHKPAEGAYDIAGLSQPSYLERLFSDLHAIHNVDHCTPVLLTLYSLSSHN